MGPSSANEQTGIPPEFRTYKLAEVETIVRGAAPSAGLNLGALEALCQAGRLKASKIGKEWRVSHLALTDFLNALESELALIPLAGEASGDLEVRAKDSAKAEGEGPKLDAELRSSGPSNRDLESPSEDEEKDPSHETRELYTGGPLKRRREHIHDAEGLVIWQGEEECFFRDGTRASSGHFQAGQKEGPWKQWFPNGVLKAEGQYRAGLQDGEWKYWDDRGNPTQKGS